MATKQKILIVDDVVSLGESLKAVEKLVNDAGGIVCGRMFILAEGDAAKRDDIIFLEELPLFTKDGKALYLHWGIVLLVFLGMLMMENTIIRSSKMSVLKERNSLKVEGLIVVRKHMLNIWKMKM